MKRSLSIFIVAVTIAIAVGSAHAQSRYNPAEVTRSNEEIAKVQRWLNIIDEVDINRGNNDYLQNLQYSLDNAEPNSPLAYTLSKKIDMYNRPYVARDEKTRNIFKRDSTIVTAHLLWILRNPYPGHQVIQNAHDYLCRVEEPAYRHFVDLFEPMLDRYQEFAYEILLVMKNESLFEKCWKRGTTMDYTDATQFNNMLKATQYWTYYENRDDNDDEAVSIPFLDNVMDNIMELKDGLTKNVTQQNKQIYQASLNNIITDLQLCTKGYNPSSRGQNNRNGGNGYRYDPAGNPPPYVNGGNSRGNGNVQNRNTTVPGRNRNTGLNNPNGTPK